MKHLRNHTDTLSETLSRYDTSHLLCEASIILILMLQKDITRKENYTRSIFEYDAIISKT